MNWLNFIWLIKEIYGKKEYPDLKRMQDLGLLAVKIGQVHALRIDFLSEKKCRHLSKLYRKTISIGVEDSKLLIKSYVNDKFAKDIIIEDYNPIASASVGQVYVGKLRGTKKRLAIKIIKGNFKKQFIKDVKSLKRLFKLIIFFYPKLAKVANPIGIIDHIEEYTLSELNLLNEIKGHNILMNIYNKNKKLFDLKKLGFAKIYLEYSNENVLVSEFIAGKTIDELLNEGKLSYNTLIELFRIHGFYMFCIGTFHGDIHPGNIILDNGKIYFIDTGAIGYVSKRLRTGLFYFFKSLSAYDYDKCAYWLNEMASKKISGEKFSIFKEKFNTLYSDFKNKTVSEVSLTKKMMETIKLGVNNGMEFEEGMFSIIKSLMYMDGMVLRCNPKAVLIKDMRRFIDEFEKHLK
ncbi:MAG: AarF/ABC1/UbiB kinase family protein [Candidatus Woesearchaeota archaeon]